MALLRRTVGALALLALAACAPKAGLRVERDGSVQLRHHSDDAVSVSVVGDFNGWNPAADPMQNEGSGRYRAVLRLPPGLYAFAFAESRPDGGVEIATPEEAQGYVEDDLGGRNGLIRIPASQ